MPKLRIQLLGEFQVVVDGLPLTCLKGDRQQSLFAYLLLHRHTPQSRQHLAFLLWPDSVEAQARADLRNLLHTLRQMLPDADHLINSDTLTLQWHPAADFTLDVAEFQHAAIQAKQASDATLQLQWLEKAISLYMGDLLPGNYDDWVMPAREELRQQFLSALEELVQLLEERGDYQAALRYGQRLLQQDSLHEPSYMRLMRLHALAGDRAGVQRIYQTCVTVLERELGVEPSPTTQAVYAQSMRMHVPVPAVESTSMTTAAASSPAPATRPRPLPSLRTAFVGRQRELADLALRLVDPTCRLLTVIGPGGMGKTRLAMETAKGHQPVFAHGIAFVPLAPVESADFIFSTIANALNLDVADAASPREGVLHHLREKEMLLVLDNFEHLIEGAAQISELLDETAAVKLLVTSRERLNLQEEWLFELKGLHGSAAVDGSGEEPGEEDEALALFLQSAQRAQQDFIPSTADLVSIHRLCQLVDGMPLGIELAATWVRMLSCAEIVNEVERSLDFLATSTRNIPDRHRSLRAVFDRSWQLLAVEESELFRRLSVFRGGFTRASAEEVAGATLPLLSKLVDKSLLQRIGDRRFDLHQLLRQYSEEQLAAAHEASPMRDLHLAYYLRWVEEDGPTYFRETAWLERIAVEYDNIWAALLWSTTGGDVEMGQRLAFSLHVYWETYGFWRQEYLWLTRLLALPQAQTPTLIRARILLHAGKYALHLVDSATACTYYEECLAIARQVHASQEVVMALIGLGDSLSDLTRAQTLYAEALALSQAAGYKEGEARAITCLGHLASGRGDYEGASALYEDALVILRGLGDSQGSHGILRELGINKLARHENQAAKLIFEECLRCA